jgi:hypothetical protein
MTCQYCGNELPPVIHNLPERTCDNTLLTKHLVACAIQSIDMGHDDYE